MCKDAVIAILIHTMFLAERALKQDDSYLLFLDFILAEEKFWR